MSCICCYSNSALEHFALTEFAIREFLEINKMCVWRSKMSSSRVTSTKYNTTFATHTSELHTAVDMTLRRCGESARPTSRRIYRNSWSACNCWCWCVHINSNGNTTIEMQMHANWCDCCNGIYWFRDENCRMKVVHAQCEWVFSLASIICNWAYVIAIQMSCVMRINIRSASLTKMCDCFDNWTTFSRYSTC